MKTLRIMVVLLNVTICLLSCDKKEEKATFTNVYLPLETGNYWQFDNTDKKEIIGTKIINGKTFYSLKYLSDTTYYRIENDKVFVIEHTGSAAVKFNLSANVNETWNFNSYIVKMVSKTDTITINNQKIINCCHFYFNIPVAVDDEHSIWLAPGIGFIQERCGECMYPVSKLNKARIGGIDFDY
jgi:hypothetical protein